MARAHNTVRPHLQQHRVVLFDVTGQRIAQQVVQDADADPLYNQTTTGAHTLSTTNRMTPSYANIHHVIIAHEPPSTAHTQLVHAHTPWHVQATPTS